MMRGAPQSTATGAHRCQAAENDADRLYTALVALRGQAAVDASLVGQAHLAAVAVREKA